MKKTKLLTSIAALALVLGLGACETTTEDSELTTETEDTTSESSSEGETTTGPTAYVLVGDFVDSNWDNEPAADSKYFIPAGTEEFKVTITTSDEPDYGEYEPWYAGLSVVEYGTWDRVAGYTELDQDASTGVKGSSDSNDVSLAWNTVYDVTLTFGETNSILVELVDPVADLLADVKENNNYSLTIEYSDFSSNTSYSSKDAIYDAYYNGTLSGSGYTFYVGLTYTKDVFLLEYYSEDDWLKGTPNDIEAYVNNGSNLDVYYISTSYDASTLYKYETQNGYSWQTYWGSLLGLVDTADLFVIDTSSYDGSSVDYSANIDSLDVLNAIVNSLFTCGNYYSYSDYCYNYAQFIYYYKTFWNTYGAPIVDSTYDLTSNEWDFGLVYLDITESKVNETTNEYRAHYYGATAYISDVGTTQISDAYSSYLQ